MSFLLPLGLLALLALPIIVLLHLLRERRQRVPVPSLLLWAHLPRRIDGERSRRLPLTLLLLLHLLVAALLGFALGGPQIAGALAPNARHTALVIDTSTSMAAIDGGDKPLRTGATTCTHSYCSNISWRPRHADHRRTPGADRCVGRRPL
jgi:Ca-activated chloride channel family protein